jgi:hypothetical protein
MSQPLKSFTSSEIDAIAKFLYWFDGECIEADENQAAWTVTLYGQTDAHNGVTADTISEALTHALERAGMHITPDEK